MTLAEAETLASPRCMASIEAIEAHRAGCRAHPAPKAILVWHGSTLTVAATCSLPVLQGMSFEEVLEHGGVLFA